jgi:hypothetical protein
LEEIMGLLKQVNIEVTDYYSKLSPEDLHQKIGPALTALAEIAELDPATIRTVDEIKNLAQAALLRYGILRQTPGGVCTSFQPCEVQFKCAGCASYCPDPARRDEVQDKITCLTKGIQLFRELGDYLTADVEKSHLRDWERILKEVDELAKTPLVLPADRSLQSLETDDLGNSLLESLAEIHSLSAGKESPCPS